MYLKSHFVMRAALLALGCLASCTGQFAAGPAGSGASGPRPVEPDGSSDPSGGTATMYTPPDNTVAAPMPMGAHARFGSTIAEQTAVMHVETELRDVADLVRTKCGVPNFDVSVAWTDYLSLRDTDFEARDRANVYACAADQVDASLKHLADSCTGSAIIRGAMQQKVSSVIGHPRVGLVDATHPSHVFALEGGVVHIQYHFCTSNTDTTNFQKVL